MKKKEEKDTKSCCAWCHTSKTSEDDVNTQQNGDVVRCPMKMRRERSHSADNGATMYSPAAAATTCENRRKKGTRNCGSWLALVFAAGCCDREYAQIHWPANAIRPTYRLVAQHKAAKSAFYGHTCRPPSLFFLPGPFTVAFACR